MSGNRTALACALLVLSVGIGETASASARPSAAHGTTRYASPHGSDSGTCPHAHPCSLSQVFHEATSGDTVIILSGTYGSGKSPLQDVPITDGTQLTIRGEAGKPAPLLYTDQSTRIDAADGSTLSDLRINHAGTSPAVYIGANSEADHLYVTATGAGAQACDVFGGLLRESVCFATGAGSYAVAANSEDGDSTSMDIVGVDAIDTASDGVGIHAYAAFGSSLRVDILDSIAEATADDVVVATGGSGNSAEADLDDSDFVTTDADDSAGGIALIGLTPEDVRVRAKLQDPFGGNLREKPSSPTVDAGTPSGATRTDLAGNQRTAGSTTDIGAYEYLPPPMLSHVHVVRRRGGFRASVRVEPGRVDTAVRLYAVRHGRSTVSRAKHTGRSAKPKLEHVVLTGLKRHTTYDVYLRAVSKGGRAHSSKVVVKTR